MNKYILIWYFTSYNYNNEVIIMKIYMICLQIYILRHTELSITYRLMRNIHECWAEWILWALIEIFTNIPHFYFFYFFYYFELWNFFIFLQILNFEFFLIYILLVNLFVFENIWHWFCLNLKIFDFILSYFQIFGI